ncbi:MAG TPA: 3,4-dioxygenase subunit beta [Micromonosporaceae bacterium]|nr:3,4-dioxygenase subunit beta [Micromonosporaceae bacterium]
MSRFDDHASDAHDHDRGLSLDLPTLLSRRRLLGLLGGVGAAAVAGCAAADSGGSATPAGSTTIAAGAATTGTTAAATAAAGEQIPEETAGPFPGDGSNGINVLTESGIVRSDITRSFGSGSAVAAGVPLTIALTVLGTANGSAPLAGAAVYLWHCDREGRYSLYDREISNENYLRGVQETDGQGSVRFASIFPAAYSGRWPHIHFEVYPSLAAATTASGKLRTSQLALPEDASTRVYATDGYEASVRNLAQTSLATDNVFRDGYSLQLGTVTGDVTGGMTVRLSVPV